MLSVENAWAASNIVLLTSIRLNSQRGQGRLLFFPAIYKSDAEKVCVIYFILIVAFDVVRKVAMNGTRLS